jgi:hypothetical protein
MLAFAHIPTGTTTNTRIDQKGFDGRVRWTPIVRQPEPLVKV